MALVPPLMSTVNGRPFSFRVARAPRVNRKFLVFHGCYLCKVFQRKLRIYYEHLQGGLMCLLFNPIRM
jgi:hypothetical protein